MQSGIFPCNLSGWIFDVVLDQFACQNNSWIKMIELSIKWFPLILVHFQTRLFIFNNSEKLSDKWRLATKMRKAGGLTLQTLDEELSWVLFKNQILSSPWKQCWYYVIRGILGIHLATQWLDTSGTITRFHGWELLLHLNVKEEIYSIVYTSVSSLWKNWLKWRQF